MAEEVITKQEADRAMANFVNWCAWHIDYVAKKFGEEEAKDHLSYLGSKIAFGMFETYKGNEKEILKTLEWFLKMVGGEGVEYVEGADRDVVVVPRCGSGGRTLREGIQEARIKHPDNPEGIPAYCYHCKQWWNDMPKERGLRLFQEYREEGPCIFGYTK